MLIQGIRDMEMIGIGHRDIKMENLMFTNDYELKIIDFGHAEKSKGQDGQYLKYESLKKNPEFGTDSYRTPESVNGEQFNLV